ncbi:hypothetical protein [Rhodococcus sp. BH5]|uniref:hypothetical protein n=1 Tax=Rhodococcus sp. BH5 TaxID=2871702 RepID=UPI0022CDB904|nr:hypothetical protein [Rhodococcus sp. BH5]
MEALQPGDALVVWRLGRSLPHLIETVAELKTRVGVFESLPRRSTRPRRGRTQPHPRTHVGRTHCGRRTRCAVTAHPLLEVSCRRRVSATHTSRVLLSRQPYRSLFQWYAHRYLPALGQMSVALARPPAGLVVARSRLFLYSSCSIGEAMPVRTATNSRRSQQS